MEDSVSFLAVAVISLSASLYFFAFVDVLATAGCMAVSIPFTAVVGFSESLDFSGFVGVLVAAVFLDREAGFFCRDTVAQFASSGRET